MADTPPAIGGEIAGHLRRLREASTDLRGPMLPPDLDLTSWAHKELAEGPNLAAEALEDPVRLTYGHVERLWFAVDDFIQSIEKLLPTHEVSWFGHVPVIRSAVESLCRLWWLTEPDIGAVARVTRFFNERVFEIAHSYEVLKQAADVLPADLIENAKAEQAAKRSQLSAWATAHGVANHGGSLGDEGRPRPMELIATIYREDDIAVAGAGILGLSAYSELSAVAHGLPDGVSRYPVLGDVTQQENRMVLNSQDLARTVLPLLDTHDAAMRRSMALFRWPITDLYAAEVLAARMYFNRATGLVD